MNENSLNEIEKYLGLITPKVNPEIPASSENDDFNSEDSNIEILNQNKELKRQNLELNLKLNELTKHFSLPLDKISKKVPELSVSIEQFMLKYAEDLVIQKAFIELSISLGKKCGITKDEVFKMAAETELNVLDNKHNPSHNTVASNTPIINQRLAQLKQISYRKVVNLRGK